MANKITHLDRRAVLGSVAGLIVASKAGAAIGTRKPLTAGHIDTHHHFLPKVYVDAIGLERLASVMPDKRAPTWSVEKALEMMDRVGVDEAMLSISSGLPVPNSSALLRNCNEVAAELRAKYPGRFGCFASLPLPDIDLSLKEISYSLDFLKADGFIIFTNYDGKYLGDFSYAPVMEELNRRKAVVFIHPSNPPYELAGLPPASVLEFPFDTTRTAASLIMSGALKRWPDIKFILSHAGGTLPFLSQRLAGPILMDPKLGERIGDVDAAIRSFWFDTAISVSKPSMMALLAIADPSRILFGTDFPMAPSAAIDRNTKGIVQAPISEELRSNIFRGNAARLLGRSED